jgi:putative oxidoreductase
MFSEYIKGIFVPLLLRLVLGAVFIFHGWHMIGIDGGANWSQGPNALPVPLQLAVAWGELIGGIAMVVGFLTRLAALGLIVIMAGAIAHVHWEHGFDITQGGFEYNVTLIVICLCLFLGGPGPLSIDWIFRLRRRGP